MATTFLEGKFIPKPIIPYAQYNTNNSVHHKTKKKNKPNIFGFFNFFPQPTLHLSTTKLIIFIFYQKPPPPKPSNPSSSQEPSRMPDSEGV